MKTKFLLMLRLAVLVGMTNVAMAQHSVARQWNEAHLEAIRRDFARPTVHARTLFHAAVAMYDAWAAYDNTATTFLLGKTVGGFTCPFQGIRPPVNVTAARNEAISYAAYRVLTQRFKNSPGSQPALTRFYSLLTALGYNELNTSTDYATGSAAALGNYIGQKIIEFGWQDGANEQNDYGSVHYEPLNPPLITLLPGNPTLVDPNRWQPLTLDVFIDQAGNVIRGSTPKFVSPEWGQVTPFALTKAERRIYQRDGSLYYVYHDPGPPPYLDTLDTNGELPQAYKWAFTLVPIWQSHHDPTDGVKLDISPAGLGNNVVLPQTLSEMRNFYNLYEGGDAGKGRALNPRTGQPYKPQIVARGDYTRVLAEFWADGPASETPPGHWFTILNYVSDHPSFEKRFKGQGPILDDLEWAVKAYLALGGAVHDAAITAWGIKGWYDYIRPISVIRWMAARGQSSAPNSPRYSPAGIPLIPGYIEVVQAGDPLAALDRRNIGKIKLYSWRAHDYIPNPDTDVAGVGWILAEEWWPYQRPTFVTPPFAGYISGHSTFSRAAAEVMTLLTGDEFFPGGMGEFLARKNAFLVFEEGPSADLTLQWATYRDASDQCSLSRLWGGIHPPIDDIPGRWLGRKIGINAFAQAERYFSGQINETAQAPASIAAPAVHIFPNPLNSGKVLIIELSRPAPNVLMQLFDLQGRLVYNQRVPETLSRKPFSLSTSGMASGIYFLKLAGDTWKLSQRVLILR